MYLTNQFFSNSSPTIDIISVGRYIGENLDMDVAGSVIIDYFNLVDDCVVFGITVRGIPKEGYRTQREDQTHTISKSLLVRLVYYKF